MQDRAIITTISVRGQTVIPVEIRRRLGLDDHAKLLWTVEGETVRVTRVPDNPVEALWGAFKQPAGEPALTQHLLQDHKREIANDN